MRGNDRLDIPQDEPVRFQFPQMLDQHFFGYAGDGLPDLAVTFRAVHYLIEDQRLPLPTNLLESICHRTCVLDDLLV